MNVLVLNCGSSSAKFAVIDPATSTEARLRASPSASVRPRPRSTGSATATKASRPIPGAGHDEALRAVGDAAERARAHRRTGRRRPPRRARRLQVLGLDGDHARGHRQGRGVHPARAAAQSARTWSASASRRSCFPALPQVGVFDTAFHQTMPPVAYTYPVPHEWLETHGVRRYGFHGTSHRFVAQQALQPDRAAGRTTTRSSPPTSATAAPAPRCATARASTRRWA